MNENLQIYDHKFALSPGTNVSHYELGSPLGAGAFGIVYKAKHIHMEEDVVVKEFFPTELAGRSQGTLTPYSHNDEKVFEDCKSRFVEEGRTLSKLRHRNVVRCRDLVMENNTAYLVMDFEDGYDFGKLLKIREANNKIYTQNALLKVFLPLAKGIAYVHSKNVLHRDIKPDNVFIRREDESPMLLDFGAAKESFSHKTKSKAPYTDFYAPIDQLDYDTAPSVTFDIHAFGALMYRAVTTNIGPKAESRALGIVTKKKDPLIPCKDAAKSEVSAELANLVDRCLAFDAAERPQSMQEVIDALESIQDEVSASTKSNDQRFSSDISEHTEKTLDANTDAVPDEASIQDIEKVIPADPVDASNLQEPLEQIQRIENKIAAVRDTERAIQEEELSVSMNNVETRATPNSETTAENKVESKPEVNSKKASKSKNQVGTIKRKKSSAIPKPSMMERLISNADWMTIIALVVIIAMNWDMVTTMFSSMRV